MRLTNLPTFGKDKSTITVVIETPRGSRNKYAYEDGLFKLKGVLAAGFSFPYDFGFIPGTIGGDGDPLDVLILMDEKAFPGCVIDGRLVGIIEAEQADDKETVRNDRLVAVAEDAQLYRDVRELEDLSEPAIEGIIHFFVSYNEFKGKKFTPLGRYGPKRALAIVKNAIARPKKKNSRR